VVWVLSEILQASTNRFLFEWRSSKEFHTGKWSQAVQYSLLLSAFHLSWCHWTNEYLFTWWSMYEFPKRPKSDLWLVNGWVLDVRLRLVLFILCYLVHSILLVYCENTDSGFPLVLCQNNNIFSLKNKTKNSCKSYSNLLIKSFIMFNVVLNIKVLNYFFARTYKVPC